MRRCIALGLLAQRATEIEATQDVSSDAQAATLVQFLDALLLHFSQMLSNGVLTTKT